MNIKLNFNMHTSEGKDPLVYTTGIQYDIV